MTTTALLHVERDRARLWRAGATAATEFALDPRLPGGGLDRHLRDEVSVRVILVVGVSLLECASVALPPVDAAMQRRLLRADAARFFALEGPVAAGCDGTMAWALSASTLRDLRDAVAAWGTVDAIVTLPVLFARAGLDGTLRVPATTATHGELQLRGGRVQLQRHVAGPLSGAATAVDWTALRALAARRVWTADDQLLDAEGEDTLRARERTRWTVAAVAVVMASIAGLMAFDARQARVQSSLATAVAARDRATQDAQAAIRRLELARDELRQLASPADQPSPLRVLARLGTLMPRDVTIEALDWDGSAWQLQGTAGDATTLLPLLTGDPLFANVRPLAPSTRFLESGRQRTSFRIGFELAPGPDTTRAGGADGQ